MKKLFIVFGTRPEAIKMAPVIKAIETHFEVKVCVTAQHREMLDQVLQIFGIEPDYDLNIMKNNQDLYDLSSRLLLGLKEILINDEPDLVLVHGDTTTSMITSLAAFYQKIPVGHVEAGLRTNNIYSPFPEEINRQVVSKIASIHFSPTQNAKNNLLKEGIDEKKIFVTGNTVIDALFSLLSKMRHEKCPQNLIDQLPFLDHKHSNLKIILVTGHRRENFGLGFSNICRSLKSIANNFNNVRIVFPVHLNPKVSDPVNKILGDIDNIFLINPLSYECFVKLMDLSFIVLTDSGGIQEEAPSLGKPVLVLRNETERPEAVEAGTVKIVGTNPVKIYNEVKSLLTNDRKYQEMSRAHNPYGEGRASEIIFEILKELKL